MNNNMLVKQLWVIEGNLKTEGKHGEDKIASAGNQLTGT